MNISKKIKTLRTERSLTRKDLADKINKSEISVRKYEEGQTNISLDTLQDICNALDVSLASLILDEHDQLFELFISQNNLHTTDKKTIAKLKIEFDCMLDFLSFKYANKKQD